MNQDYIEFDLKLEDFKAILVLVNNLTNESLQCNNFSENECHHLKKDHYMHFNLENCSFCKFIKILRDKHSSIRIKQELDNLNLYIKYKTINYPSQIIDWVEFQEWRSPYSLISFSTCTTQSDLLNAIKKHEKLVQVYKKTIVSSKLFIDFHLKHENNESFQKSFNQPYSSSSKPIFITQNSLPVIKNYNSTTQTSHSLNDQNIETIDTEIENINSLVNLDISNESNMNNKESVKVISSVESSMTSLIDVDLNELEEKLKLFKDDIIYLDFLFASNNADKLTAILETEKNKIETIINSVISSIFKKLFYLANQIDPNNDRQFSIYSDLLKTPFEKKIEEEKQTSSFLSIKVINKKMISSRMAKYKADLYLTLNLLDLAFMYYTLAYDSGKKEQDLNWTYSALHGLCIVSYLILKENNKLELRKQSTWTQVLGNFLLLTIKYYKIN
jgi:hypothetical protein